MKKRAVIVFFTIILILNLFLVFAQESNATSDVSDKGYECLESKVEGECSSLSTEEKIFSLLAIRKCKSDLLSDSKDNECWPSSGCKIKPTAQAMLALDEVNSNTDKSATWLFSQKAIPPNLEWLLQIESTEPTSCTISYSENPYTINIGEDKRIDRNAGTCLRLYEDNYWLKVSEDCYEIEFEISCSEYFSTNLLYKDKTSFVVYVSQKTSSSSGEGRTQEKVNSFCFAQGNTCDYEGSLWAAIVLDSLDYDVSPYIPYLIALAENNQKLIPEVFLYLLLGDSYRNDVLIKQKENKWWYDSGDKFYDTALALYPFQNEQLTEKTNSIEWLEEVQGSDGCWQGNIRNTAFILYSLWPKEKEIPSGVTEIDCEDKDYFCMSKANCEDIDGEELDYTGCFGLTICCSKEKQLETCEEQAGIICYSDENCIGGITVDASDLSSQELCCVDGECIEEEQESECDLYGGYCRSSCYGNEEQKDYGCTSGICCIKKPDKKANYTLIIVFSILIFLVLIGFAFRKKLRQLWLRFRTRRRGKGQPGARPRFGPKGFPPSSPPRRIPRRIIPRRIIPPQTKPKRQTRPAPKTKAKGEIEEVLKKLKEIGK